MQREFQKHTGVRDYSVKDSMSPGICHQVAREEFIEPGDLVLATDSPHHDGRRVERLRLRGGSDRVRATLRRRASRR